VKAAADTFRANPDIDTEEAIGQLGVGEALVSTLEAKGVPSMVGRTMMRPPSSRLGPITPAERDSIIAKSPVSGRYDEMIDRESASEVLEKRARERQRAEELERQREADEKERSSRTGYSDDYRDDRPARRSTGSRRQSVEEAAIKSFARTVARQLGNSIVRGILGSLKRGR